MKKNVHGKGIRLSIAYRITTVPCKIWEQEIFPTLNSMLAGYGSTSRTISETRNKDIPVDRPNIFYRLTGSGYTTYTRPVISRIIFGLLGLGAIVLGLYTLTKGEREKDGFYPWLFLVLGAGWLSLSFGKLTIDIQSGTDVKAEIIRPGKQNQLFTLRSFGRTKQIENFLEETSHIMKSRI